MPFFMPSCSPSSHARRQSVLDGSILRDQALKLLFVHAETITTPGRTRKRGRKPASALLAVSSDMLEWLVVAACAPASFFVWAAVHELSHYVVLRSFVKVESAKFRLYPHRARNGRLVWASVEWRAEAPTARQMSWVSMAPRLPDLAGCAGACISAWVWGWSLPGLAMTALLAGAVVDLGVGSTGVSAESDLRRASRGWDVPPWLFRVSGFAVVVASSAGVLYGLLR